MVMYTLDRFARNRYDSAIYKAKLKKNGVRVYYAKQPMPDTPEGIILESVLEGYAEYYSENLARNIKRGIRENALQGLATGGANLLLGYTVGEDRKYAIDPTGAKIVQEIFQLYADGMSATQIIAYCNERGYKTARGNAFNKNSLRTILRNEKYIGTYKLMDIVIPDGMPAIIDKVLFEKVQAMLKHNGKARAKAKAHENYLLTTKLFCGHCGSPMVGESGTSKTGQVHYYYKCTKAKREHSCKKKSERKDWIEKLVVRYTVQNVLTNENIALIAKRAMEIIEKESADTTYLDGLNAELKDVQKKIKNLVSAIEQGIITSATKDRLDELEQEKSDIEGRIAREEMKKPLLNESRVRYWLTSFKSGNVDDEDYQRRVIDTLVNSVYVYDDEDGGKRIVLTFNLSGNNTATLTSSDIECYAPPMTRILLLRCSCYFYTHARFSNLRLIFTRYDKICIIIPEGDPMRILLAEDEKSLNRIITKQLKAAGYSVDSCFDGGEAYDLITSTDYDAAVFDVMMPIMNGFELVKKIRAHGIDTPVLFLTARDSIEDRVTGLDIGADDYLIKPFSFDELSARLRVMTRKKYGEKTGIISVGDLTVDTAARRVERAGREISLSAKEYELLQYLVMNKGVVLSREKIEDHIWNYDYEGGTNVVDVYIRYLRKKIDEGEDIKLIHTVRGAGYVIK